MAQVEDINIKLFSFGHSFGVPIDVDLLFSIRHLPVTNVENYQQYDGRHQRIQNELLHLAEYEGFLETIIEQLKNFINEHNKNSITIAVGCEQGRHRCDLETSTIGLKVGTVICQVDYSENFTLVNQDQIQSAHWSNQQVSIFTAYAWMSNSGGEGYSFGFVADSAKHDKYCVITCLENLVEEIINIMSDVNEIIFFSDGAARQFKNRYVIQHLTTMMDKFDINFSRNYFTSSHGKGIVDSIGGTLERLVWMEIMTGVICSSAKEFVDICRRKTRTIIVNLVQQAQFDTTRVTLENTF
ncbi:unnamed protein product [Rotaria socialis]|uniref:RapZ C-terminal domain-containing protein n=4 Tax=Rotaria socialis TaxID=392032 RepID=A0A817Q1X9_9BILA|nr:unnamed protein product [Rotaria socialis]